MSKQLVAPKSSSTLIVGRIEGCSEGVDCRSLLVCTRKITSSNLTAQCTKTEEEGCFILEVPFCERIGINVMHDNRRIYAADFTLGREQLMVDVGKIKLPKVLSKLATSDLENSTRSLPVPFSVPKPTDPYNDTLNPLRILIIIIFSLFFLIEMTSTQPRYYRSKGVEQF